jgi:hypothetical protein
MTFSEQPPSKQWSPLKYRGETLAAVWFKPEGEPFALMFRIPQRSFQILGAGQQLSAENLLKAVGIAAAEVESWRDDGASDSDESRSDSELRQPLAAPPEDVAHLNLFVRLRPPAVALAPGEGDAPEIDEDKWQYIEGRWNAILGLEASVDNLRMSVEGLRSELEAAARMTLHLEVKHHALSADMVQWEKTRSRIRYTLPKAREFIHRSTWATGAPERKQLLTVYEAHIQPRVPFPELAEVLVQIESVLKDRQNLSAQGTSVHQECKAILADFQGALRTLQSNAAANAARKKGAFRSRGKSL